MLRVMREKIAFFAFHAFVVEDSRFQQNRVRAKLNLVPRASFPLTSGRKTRALGATISGMRHSMPWMQSETA